MRVRWSKRIWRCPEQACDRQTWTEDHVFARPRAKLTARATDWAVDALRHDDTTISAIARHVGVAWDTCWKAFEAAARTLIERPDRVRGVKTIGVDEHIWRPSKISSTDKAVTVMVDLTVTSTAACMRGCWTRSRAAPGGLRGLVDRAGRRGHRDGRARPR